MILVRLIFHNLHIMTVTLEWSASDISYLLFVCTASITFAYLTVQCVCPKHFFRQLQHFFLCWVHISFNSEVSMELPIVFFCNLIYDYSNKIKFSLYNLSRNSNFLEESYLLIYPLKSVKTEFAWLIKGEITLGKETLIECVYSAFCCNLSLLWPI